MSAHPGPAPSPTPDAQLLVTAFTVIAHRGASGYLPEHTLAGAAMAHAMCVDFIELDTVLTRDGELVVLHDLVLDAMTNVAECFSGRQRADGRHYAADFTLTEIQSLRVGERQGQDGKPEFPGRFPAGLRPFRVPTLRDEISLIQGLNRATGRNVGIYIEPKAPAWHRDEGKDLFPVVLAQLAEFGLTAAQSPVILQSFDHDELRRARYELGSELRLVQLIGENEWQESPTDFDHMRSEAGLREIAGFAQGIGPWLPQVVEIKEDGRIDISDLTARAHHLDLFVHGYTLRSDQLPPQAPDFSAVVELLIRGVKLDGVFADQPDLVIEAVSNLATD